MVVLRGLPGSGKSTLALEYTKKNFIRICKDSIRIMLGIETGVDEDAVQGLYIAGIRYALNHKRDLVVDCTHVDEKNIEQLKNFASCYGNITFIVKTLKLTPTQCIERDKNRTAKVGEAVILKMWKRSQWGVNGFPHDYTEYLPPKPRRADCISTQLPDAFICDLDGTLAIIGDRSPYDASQCDLLDTTCSAVFKTTSALIDKGMIPVFVSGRSSKDRDATVRYIENVYKFDSSKYFLYMRDELDRRSDDLVKIDLYNNFIANNYNVVVVFDDRPSVVRQWRLLGLTVFQLDDREF